MDKDIHKKIKITQNHKITVQDNKTNILHKCYTKITMENIYFTRLIDVI